MRILLIGALLVMGGCREFAVYDCTGVGRVEIGEYMGECRRNSSEGSCVDHVQELFCKPVFKVKR